MSARHPSGRVLLVHPDFDRLGGIENTIRKVQPLLELETESIVLARRPGEARGTAQVLRLIKDYRAFVQELARGDVALVHLNPSLDLKGLLRESAYARAARRRGVKTLVFLHGWRNTLERRFDAAPWLFRRLFGGVDAFMVLGCEFETALRRWGITQAIFRVPSVVRDSVLDTFDLETATRARRDFPCPVILFAGRVMRQKGIFTLIDAFTLLRENGMDAKLIVAGDGPDLEAARRRVGVTRRDEVQFLGRVALDRMADIYTGASLFCLPTQEEGMPNVLVEAMAFGLPVVTCPVGAIGDVFESGRNGMLIEPRGPAEHLAKVIRNLLEDAPAMERMGRTNNAQAKVDFRASRLAARWDAAYRELLGEG